MQIIWRERIIAAAIHFLATLLVAGLAAALIFLVWFPGAMAEMVGGRALFFIVIACDLTLGPLISLVIYNSKKSRKELIIDYTVVAVVQLAALFYGVSIVAASRPVFVAFYVDRLEIVTAIELDDADLAQGTAPEFRSKSWTGPRLVAVERTKDSSERIGLVFSAIAGKDGQLFPKYYREYDTQKDEIISRGQSIESLLKNSGIHRDSIEAAISGTDRQANDLRWLLVHHRFGFGVALIDSQTGRPLQILGVDPTWTDQMPTSSPAAAPTKPAD